MREEKRRCEKPENGKEIFTISGKQRHFFGC